MPNPTPIPNRPRTNPTPIPNRPRTPKRIISLAPKSTLTQAEPPPTLLIINPGDTAFETTPPGKHEVGN